MRKNHITLNFYLAICLFFISAASFSQTLSGTVIDQETQETIPFATIQIGENYGVITNDEGVFSISTERFTPNDSLVFSSLGYDRKAIAIKDYTGENVYLDSNVDSLDEVYIISKDLDPLIIMQKVNENISENHPQQTAKLTIYQRNKDNNKTQNSDISIKKANFINKQTLRNVNIELNKLSENSKEESSNIYYDTYFEIYKNDQDSLKLDIKKGTKLINLERNTSSENVPNKAFEIIAEKLETDNTFKMRSGIIPMQDSVNLKNQFSKRNKNDSISLYSRNWKASEVLRKFNFEKETDLTFVTNYKKYDYTIAKAFNYNGELVYVLNFKPKRSSANYSGEIYISAENYAVLKAKYQYAPGETGQKMNLKLLLGIKYEELDREVLIIFNKLQTGTYGIKYIKTNTKQYYYLNRSFTFIENTKNRKDRMKLKLELMTEGFANNEIELLVINNEIIPKKTFDQFKQEKYVTIQTIEEYDPAIWSNYNIIAPNQAIKDFEN